MSATMHFVPEWTRTKNQPLARSQAPPSPPPASSLPSSTSLSSYSALVSVTPPVNPNKSDEAHPFRYSKEEFFNIYQGNGWKGELGLEVERWEGVVREVAAEPITLLEMTEAEKKVCCRLRIAYPFSNISAYSHPAFCRISEFRNTSSSKSVYGIYVPSQYIGLGAP